MNRPVALITGGSRGIGRAISLRLARDGYYTIVNYRSDEASALKTLSEIREGGGEGERYAADITDEDAVRAMFAAIDTQHGRLDLLVNNAGAVSESLFALTPPAKFMELIRVNLGGVVLCTHAALRIMLRRKHGTIVNISSASAFRCSPGMSAYASAKAAVNALTASVAREVAPFGIRVNAVAPAWVDTEMMTEERRAAIAPLLAQTPLKRLGTAEEVAAAVSAVARDEMSYLVGQVVLLDGGAIR